ncbi:hypothetical protein FB567DRAFT_595795 [Paraphoma chrysanthemicola]|uniref:Uncharacterized protein n=1 Tax=Paraphoma chrysanthemicola TaxID=798071 RepID=A0A8K0VV50_9PLEO|nr:hypothetical protein FB567DRAFT_595795 [Paraphoma chrysanthemicola]
MRASTIIFFLASALTVVAQTAPPCANQGEDAHPIDAEVEYALLVLLLEEQAYNPMRNVQVLVLAVMLAVVPNAQGTPHPAPALDA